MKRSRYPFVNRGGKKTIKRNADYFCECGNSVSRSYGRCHSCANKNRAGTYHISKEALIKKIKNHYKRTDPEKWKKIKIKIGKKSKGRKHSKEDRIKMSLSIKKAYKEGRIINWQKGLTKETDERIRLISKKLEGRKCSEHMKEAVRNARNKEYANGRKPPMLGKKHTDEAKEKCRNSTLRLKRDKIGRFLKNEKVSKL